MSPPDAEAPGAVPTPLSPLAQRIVEDIQRRGLGPGDRYLTAVEAGARFGVSPATANRALGLLAQHGVVERRPRHGTRIASGFRPERGAGVSCLLVFFPEARRERLGPEVHELTEILLTRFGESSVQLCPLPERDTAATVLRTLRAVGEGCIVAGAVAISCPAEVYRVLGESGIPAVVFGCLYPGQRGLVAINPDLAAAGEMLARCLIRRGHRRLALLQVTELRPGDDHFLNGAAEALAASGLAANPLRVGYVPPDHSAIEARVRELLEGPDAPTGFLLNGWTAAEHVLAALDRLDPDLRDGTEVVFYDHRSPQIEETEIPHARSAMERREMAEIGVEALWTQYRGRPVEGGERLVPVEMVEPPPGEDPGGRK